MKKKTFLMRKQNSFPNVVIKISSCHCVTIPRAKNDIISKETLVSMA